MFSYAYNLSLLVYGSNVLGKSALSNNKHLYLAKMPRNTVMYYVLAFVILYTQNWFNKSLYIYFSSLPLHSMSLYLLFYSRYVMSVCIYNICYLHKDSVAAHFCLLLLVPYYSEKSREVTLSYKTSRTFIKVISLAYITLPPSHSNFCFLS